MKKRVESNEIDLIEVIFNIWNNKVKIIIITFGFVVLSTMIHFIINPLIKSTTEIKPINVFENNLYKTYNGMINSIPVDDKNSNIGLIKEKFDVINKGYLLGLFLENLDTRELLVDAIIKYQLINKDKFSDEDKYFKKVQKEAFKINLVKPIDTSDKRLGVKTKTNWTIEHKIKLNDKKKWEKIFKFLEGELNNDIQQYLKKNFQLSLKDLRKLNQFKIQDLDIKIQNARENYKLNINHRLTFLREQLSIAKELNIKNNTLDVDSFTTPSGIISNVQTEKPYYMRGYLMIEKEIELIETRTDPDAFTNNLSDLEEQKRDLLSDKSLYFIENLFNSTPVVSNNFKAGRIIYKDTKYDQSFSLIKTILFSGIFGIIFGMFYVLIQNKIQQRK